MRHSILFLLTRMFEIAAYNVQQTDLKESERKSFVNAP
jgi:hypothetical protein